MLRFMESFDHYAIADIASKWSALYATNLTNPITPSSTYVTLSATGRNGTNGLTLRGNNASTPVILRKGLDNRTAWVVGGAFKLTALPLTTQPLLRFYDGSTSQFEVQITSSGLLCLVVGGVVKATGTTTLAANAFYYIECLASISTSVAANACAVHLNGVLEVTMPTSTSTATSGTAQSSSIVFWAPSGIDMILDDIYICDTSGSANNTYLGDVRVEALLPTGAGNYTNWTPLSGANYASVNQTAEDGDTTYVGTSTLTTLDSYAMADLSSTPANVMGIQTVLVARKDDAGNRSVAALIRQASTDYPGATAGLGDGFTFNMEVRETDPNTSAAWTGSGINSLEAGVKLVG